MKARDFFDELRLYPDLDVDIFVKIGDVLVNISGVDCDEQGNNLRTRKQEIHCFSWGMNCEKYLRYLFF